MLSNKVAQGNIASLTIEIDNVKDQKLSMVTAIIGLPGGCSIIPEQLKKLQEEQVISSFELFQNNLVLYWDQFDPLENKEVLINLKAEVPGQYLAPASCVYPYYGDEFKHWIKGESIEISSMQEGVASE